MIIKVDGGRAAQSNQYTIQSGRAVHCQRGLFLLSDDATQMTSS